LRVESPCSAAVDRRWRGRLYAAKIAQQALPSNAPDAARAPSRRRHAAVTGRRIGEAYDMRATAATRCRVARSARRDAFGTPHSGRFHDALEDSTMKAHTPASIAPPAALYVHGMEVAPNVRWLFISGQIGMQPDGRPGATAREQAEIIWSNIQTILASAGMNLTNIVKLTTYSTSAEHLPALREVRERVLAGHLPASTLLVVAGLAKPEWLV
jgi:enamine deaminase RidA (YjgF/YER057c/UK114 family)